MSFRWTFAAACVVMCVTAAAARAVTPAVGGRVLHYFDFEERDDGNFEDVPMFFDRVEGVGMPHWSAGRLAVDKARSGRHSFRLDIHGGSVAYRLRHGVLPATPGARYRIEGVAQTTDLRFARARLTAYLTDARGVMVPGSLRQSSPFVGKDAWHPLGVETLSDHPDAAWLVFEIGLLQPKAGGGEGGDTHDASDTPPLDVFLDDDLRRFRQDTRGSAWFDDIVVSRVPDIRVVRDDHAGLYRTGDHVRLVVEAADADADDLGATGVVRNAAGDVVWSGDATAEAVGEPGGRARVHYGFDVGRLPPGAYSAELAVAAATPGAAHAHAAATAARSTRRFVVLPAGVSRLRTDPRFAIDATHLREADWANLHAALAPLGVGRVEVAVWGGPGNNDVGERAGVFDDAAARLIDSGIKITAVFAGPTPSLAGAAGGATWAALHDAVTAGTPAASGWRANLGYLVSRHAHLVDRWQVGTASDADGFADDPAMRDLYARFADVIASLVVKPDLAMPWPLRRAADARPKPTGYVLNVPADLPPRQIPLYVADAVRTAGVDVGLYLGDLDAAPYGRVPALADRVRRITLALAGGARHLTLPLPYTHAADENDAEPTEAYLVLHTLLDAVGNRAYQGRVPAGHADDHVEAYLFADPADPDAGGTLVVWGNPAHAAGRVTLEMNLAHNAHHVDLWGNATRLTQSATGRRVGVADVTISSTPSFIVGVDAPLTRLRQTVALDNALIESSFRPHARRLRLTNTFPRQISGTLRIASPEGWAADLPGSAFSLNPGETLDRPLELRIPYNSDAGNHRLDVHLRISGGRDDIAPGGAGFVDVVVPLEVRLGLADVGLRTLAAREGRDLVVEQTITNYGRTPIDYEAFVLVPGHQRQERLVVGLGPGREAVRRYRLPGAGDVPGGTRILSGLREIEGTRVLNDRVEL